MHQGLLTGHTFSCGCSALPCHTVTECIHSAPVRALRADSARLLGRAYWRITGGHFMSYTNIVSTLDLNKEITFSLASGSWSLEDLSLVFSHGQVSRLSSFSSLSKIVFLLAGFHTNAVSSQGAGMMAFAFFLWSSPWKTEALECTAFFCQSANWRCWPCW